MLNKKCIYFSRAINLFNNKFMKINKTFLKTIRAFIIILALTFSTNTQAATSLTSNWSFMSWLKGSNHKEQKKTGNKQKKEKRNDWKPRHQKGGKGEGDCKPGDSVPLDGGLSILLIGAAAFGVKKLRGSKNDEI